MSTGWCAAAFDASGRRQANGNSRREAGDDQADRKAHGGPDKVVYAYAVEAVPPGKKFRAMVDWATMAPRLTLFRAARNHRCQANRAARAAVNSTGNGATTRREASVPGLPASPSSIPLATVPQAHGNDNCPLSLMPSAGRTHRKVKKKN